MLLPVVGIPAAVVVCIATLTWAVNHPAAASSVIGSLARLVTWVSKRAKLAATGRTLEGDLSSALQALNAEAGDLLPNEVRVQWVESESRDAFFDDDDIVVRLRPHDNPDRNYVIGTATLVETGLFAGARSHVDPRVLKAADLVIGRKIILSCRSPAVDLYDREVMAEALAADAGLASVIESLWSIDANGLFTTVFLRELQDRGRRLATHPLGAHTQLETRDFVQFLTGIANGTATELHFRGSSINVAIVLIGLKSKVLAGDVGPYLKAVQGCLDDHSRTIYLCAYGRPNVTAAKKVAAHARGSSQIQRVEEYWRGGQGTVIGLFPRSVP